MNLSKAMLLPLVLLAFFSSCELRAHANHNHGVSWLKNTEGVSFAEVKKMAKAQKKIIFIDFYTKWCGPCKAMDAEVFSKPSVGDYYNAKFVNFKVDAEEGEGIDLAELFEVSAYPTFIYTDANGKPMPEAVITGSRSAQDMLVFARQITGEVDKKSLSWYEKQYSNGNRELDFLTAYVRAATEHESAELPDNIDQDIYWATPESERFKEHSDTYNSLYYGAIPGNFYYDQLMAHKDKFARVFDVSEREYRTNYISSMIIRTSRMYSGDAVKKQQILDRIKKDFSDVYDIAVESSDLLMFGFDPRNDSDTYIKRYLNWVESNSFSINYDPIIFPQRLIKMKELTPEYAKLGVSIYADWVEQDKGNENFFAQASYCYMLYKSGKEKAAFDRARKLSKVTDSYRNSRRMSSFYKVMKALQAGEDPTDIMVQ